MAAKKNAMAARKARRGSPAARRCRQAAYAALLAVGCVGLAAFAGAALEHSGLRLVESDSDESRLTPGDNAQAVRLLTWSSQLSALGPAAANRLLQRAPLVGPQLAAACWSGLQPESSYALGHAMLQILQSVCHAALEPWTADSRQVCDLHVWASLWTGRQRRQRQPLCGDGGGAGGASPGGRRPGQPQPVAGSRQPRDHPRRLW